MKEILYIKEIIFYLESLAIDNLLSDKKSVVNFLGLSILMKTKKKLLFLYWKKSKRNKHTK